MDLKDPDNLIKARRKQLELFMCRKMTVIVCRMAKEFFQDKFRQGDFCSADYMTVFVP